MDFVFAGLGDVHEVLQDISRIEEPHILASTHICGRLQLHADLGRIILGFQPTWQGVPKVQIVHHRLQFKRLE